ncbi:IclR family transcriptional regulator [Mycolicibacterium stellerae]|uniref:IclR family transcriptional regulator n=1 Tax=Mycolicibacterium stellerae TaxID=2358193 RepID=UPI000F0B444D|nr:IclR family transcriptional regulator [Mycolicibacterium stellerae]
MAGNARDAGRTTASRLFAVMDAFADRQGPMTLSEISRATQIPVSTTSRLVAEMSDWGGLRRRSDGAFEVGIRLWRVGVRAASERELHEGALAAMQDVHDATGQHVQLYVRDEGGIVHLAKVADRRCLPGATAVGSRVPLHATASGKVFLAFAESRLLADTIDAGLRRYTRWTITEGRQLARAVENVGRSGVAYSREERRPGVSAVAAPIMVDDVLVGTLAVVGPATTDLRRHERRLTAAAQRVADAVVSRRTPDPTAWLRFD